jgi:hypothetical protein
MNDSQIRESFHRKRLRKHHANPETVVIDELGLKHGVCRADIAVINGHLLGYEIKSDEDSLRRLPDQVDAYGAVFDRITLVVAERHLNDARRIIPTWWGVIVASEGRREAVHFRTMRQPDLNSSVDNFSIAQLLWRDEVQEILSRRGVTGSLLRQKRSILYRELIGVLEPTELRSTVRGCLKSRKNWRHPEPPSPCDDSSQPFST